MKDNLKYALTQFKEKMEAGEFPCCNSLEDSCNYCQYLGVCNKGVEEDYWTGLFNEDDGED